MSDRTRTGATDLVIRGARTHNLKNVDLSLPLERLVVLTGVSGSGKSSLAFDTIYAEGQRRYVESLSAYARQFLERMEKPDVDRIDGLCPAIAIRQKNSIRNPRSTVGTTTEIHDYLRLLYSRIGRTFCRNCGEEVVRESPEVVARRLGALPEGTRLILGFEMPIVAGPAENSAERKSGDYTDFTDSKGSSGDYTDFTDSKGSSGDYTDFTDSKGSSGDYTDFTDSRGSSGDYPSTRTNGSLKAGTDYTDDSDVGDLLSPVSEMGQAENGDNGGNGHAQATTAEAVKATIDALRRKGFGRLLVGGRSVEFDDVAGHEMPADANSVRVVVDRIKVQPDVQSRLTDSIEVAYLEGGGAAFALEPPADDSAEGTWHVFSERFECTKCGISYEDPQPRLFSFNNPFGACPTCHGFGNVIELDMDLVVPDKSKSISEGAIEPWTKPHYRSNLAELKKAARKAGIRLDVPWADLTDQERRFVMEGDGDDYEGIRGFFDWLERKKYKVHVRVFLSRYRGYLTCPDCGGARLRREARDVKVAGRSIDEVSSLTVRDAQQFFNTLKPTEKELAIAGKVLNEIGRRLSFLHDVGLDYLTLDRLSSTLSGGEAQRINLATSLGSALVGTLYVLDEPSVGLHPRDNQRLIDILRKLRDQGNSVLVVEHDADMITVADHIVDLGLGAGEQGGKIVYSGTLDGLLQEPRSLTAKYLRTELAIPVPAIRKRGTGQMLRVIGAAEHNLKNITVQIPLNTLTCITGVSGSGKSTLVHDIIYPAVKRAKGSWEKRVGAMRKLEGSEYVTDAVLIDQTPIGRTPRSNPVTYLKAFDPIRELFASTKDARSRGLTASHFSFNVPGGRCEACEGEGQVRVEMQFLADVFVPCDECDGKRFKASVLEVKYRGKNVHQVLDMTVREALAFFSSSAKVVRRLQVLDEIGLGYLRLGQPATTLSGGEAQRIKIASHLASHTGERLLYILDEPTTGLHFDDIAKLLTAFRKLLEAGHSLLVIEHNLDIIKTADHVIDLGPEGGDEGGWIVATGTPEQIAHEEVSHTGKHLVPVLAAGRSHAYASSRQQ